MTWTPERHAAAKQRCEQATDGPWEDLLSETHWPDGRFSVNGPSPHHTLVCHMPYTSISQSKATASRVNGQFIAAARTDLPDALAEIERKEAKIVELEGMLEASIEEINRLQDELDGLSKAVRVFTDDAEVIEFSEGAYAVNVLKPKLDNLYAVAQKQEASS